MSSKSQDQMNPSQNKILDLGKGNGRMAGSPLKNMLKESDFHNSEVNKNETIDRQWLLNLHRELTEEARSLSERKNHDYSGGKDSTHPFLNFTRCESMGVCATEAGIMVRLTDKMSRLSTFITTGSFKVKDEALRDTILDVINYVIILYAYIQSKKIIKND